MFTFEGETGLAGLLSGQNGEMMGSFASLALLVVMFVVFYFILIRPQKKKDKELKEQMDKLQVGDRVVTIGGLVGFVANMTRSRSPHLQQTHSLLSQRTLSRQLLRERISIPTVLSRRLMSLRRQVCSARRRKRSLKTKTDILFIGCLSRPGILPGLLITN